MPPWIIDLLKPVEAAALGLLIWYAKEAHSDRKTMLARLNEINGSVKKNTWWIEGHEEFTKEQTERFEAIEERERKRLEDSGRYRK